MVGTREPGRGQWGQLAPARNLGSCGCAPTLVRTIKCQYKRRWFFGNHVSLGPSPKIVRQIRRVFIFWVRVALDLGRRFPLPPTLKWFQRPWQMVSVFFFVLVIGVNYTYACQDTDKTAVDQWILFQNLVASDNISRNPAIFRNFIS